MTSDFVDDSSSVVTFPDQNNVRKYLEVYYSLLHAFYNANKLKLNADKTVLMLDQKSKYINYFKKI